MAYDPTYLVGSTTELREYCSRQLSARPSLNFALGDMYVIKLCQITTLYFFVYGRCRASIESLIPASGPMVYLSVFATRAMSVLDSSRVRSSRSDSADGHRGQGLRVLADVCLYRPVVRRTERQHDAWSSRNEKKRLRIGRVHATG